MNQTPIMIADQARSSNERPIKNWPSSRINLEDSHENFVMMRPVPKRSENWLSRLYSQFSVRNLLRVLILIIIFIISIFLTIKDAIISCFCCCRTNKNDNLNTNDMIEMLNV
ncbi:hypothetical protein DERP_014786 [Dermatophagoides pteronyssinus]|uniref:Uncharacterized protein n=1 Tax=Dermatophagoides pteronyssinus TaxID=6956 RepID=A0ABQ8J2E8_DERPT|nr:hypothetical protein DERP_014786 [Dermatophagoides pteronyssinus]